MIRITRVFSDADIESIAKLAMDNYIELTAHPLKTRSPVSDLAKTVMGIEVRGYLAEAASQSPRLNAGVVVAKNPDNEVVGFALFIRADGSCCGLSYCAVANQYRGQGIFRRLVDDIKSRFTTIGLTCHLNTVPVYEKLGFAIYWRKDNQIEMSWGPYDASTYMPHIGFDNEVNVKAATNAFYNSHTPKALAKIQKDAAAFTNARSVAIDVFLRSRQIKKP